MMSELEEEYSEEYLKKIHIGSPHLITQIGTRISIVKRCAH